MGNFDRNTVEGQIYFISDTGEVRLQPESDHDLRTGLVPWLGESALISLSVHRTPAEVDDGCFRWKKLDDCSDSFYMIAVVEDGNGDNKTGKRTVVTSLMRNHDGDLRSRGVNEPEIPLTWRTLELLSQTATAKLVCDEWLSEQATLHRPGDALSVQPYQFRIVTTAEYQQITLGQMSVQEAVTRPDEQADRIAA